MNKKQFCKYKVVDLWCVDVLTDTVIEIDDDDDIPHVISDVLIEDKHGNKIVLEPKICKLSGSDAVVPGIRWRKVSE